MSKYDKVIDKVFFDNYRSGHFIVPFDREELADACKYFGIPRIKNLGDIPYSYRFRKELPPSIKLKAPQGGEWIIVGGGIAKYQFRLASPAKIQPSGNRYPIQIPEATPEIVKHYAPGTDEQALLTRVRYNRLVDIFTGLTCYSIQNHLRTTVEGIGQIEVDEIYLGINKTGAHFVLPCQAKSPGDKFGIVQVMQDIALCEAEFPETVCRPIALQFLGPSDVALFELKVKEENQILKLLVVDEKHFKFIQSEKINKDELFELKAKNI